MRAPGLPRLAAAVLLFATLPVAHAALIDTSAPFQVSRVFYGTDRNVLAASTSGGFVVVWHEYHTLEGPSVLMAARIDLHGQNVGSSFSIVTAAANHSARHPSLQAFPDGGFVISWLDQAAQRAVYAQRFDSTAMPIGTQIVVTGPTSDAIVDPTVAAAGDGSFLVVWRSPVSDGSELQAMRYDASGAPAPPGTIEPSEGGSADLRSVAASGGSDGTFVVAWTAGYTYQTGAAGGYYLYTAIHGRGRIVEADGTTPDPILVAGGRYGPHVRHLSSGDFVVVWSDSYRSYDVFPEPLDAYAAIHRSDGTVDSALVSTRIGYDEDGPHARVAASGDGGFVVAWSHYSRYPEPSDPADLMVAQRDADGASLGATVPLVVESHVGAPIDPALAVSDDRSLLVWHEGNTIRGQILETTDEVVCGDASRDGVLSASDALRALLAAVGIRYCSRLLCDADGNGTVEPTDALLVLQAASGLPTVLSCI